MRYTIEEIHEAARKRGGRCLSKAYSTTRKLLFECAKGHRWWTNGTAVTQGHWCHRCTGSGGVTLDEIHALVKPHGGRCVTTRYIPGADVVVECKEGHQFTTRPYTLRAGHWCARCAGRRKTLEDAQALAASKGGTCLATRYSPGVLAWKCGRGHVFRRNYTGARLQWCPECSSRRRLTTADMREAAKRHDGRFLSPAYRPRPHKLEWECKNGHRWEAIGASVHRGGWCSRCLGRNPTVDELRELASSRGGRFLSPAYRPRPFKLAWSCAEGHRWNTTAFLVRQGYWCPECAGNVRLTIELMRQIARRQGGRCLSASYHRKARLRWRCREGHEWLQRGAAVNKGQWCPACSDKPP